MHDLEGFEPSFRNVEGELFDDSIESRVEVRTVGIKLRGDGTDWGYREAGISTLDNTIERQSKGGRYALTVSKKGLREHTSEGVWKS